MKKVLFTLIALVISASGFAQLIANKTDNRVTFGLDLFHDFQLAPSDNWDPRGFNQGVSFALTYNFPLGESAKHTVSIGAGMSSHNYFSYSRIMNPYTNGDFVYQNYRDVENFKRWNRAFLAHHNIDSIRLIDSTKCQLPGAVFDPPYANVMGTCIMAAGKGKWKNYTREDTVALRFDVALVTKGFHSQISRLKELIDCDTIVLSGGIYGDDNVTLDNECRSSRIPYYNIKQSGAYQKYY